jgi:hypothetical protein
VPARVDLTGRAFGRLTVIARALCSTLTSGRRLTAWVCRCACGAVVDVPTQQLASGRTKSCGCLRVDLGHAKRRTHGESSPGHWSPEYRAWSGLIQRCTNPKNTDWANYGGRGITVCDRWRRSFEAFLADMGRKPTPSHSIDRKDVDGNYEPGNCRWATPSQQASNRRRRSRQSANPAATGG